MKPEIRQECVAADHTSENTADEEENAEPLEDAASETTAEAAQVLQQEEIPLGNPKELERLDAEEENGDRRCFGPVSGNIIPKCRPLTVRELLKYLPYVPRILAFYQGKTGIWQQQFFTSWLL